MAAEPDPTLAPKEPETRVPLSIEKGIAALSMAALCLITLGNVIARYLTNYSFAFTEEYSIALMVVVTMLGASYATAADRQIRITWFADLMPPQGRRIAEMLATIATIAMFGLLIVLGGKVVWDEYRFEVTSPALASRSGSTRWRCRCSRPPWSGAPSGTASASGAAGSRPSTTPSSRCEKARCSL